MHTGPKEGPLLCFGAYAFPRPPSALPNLSSPFSSPCQAEKFLTSSQQLLAKNEYVQAADAVASADALLADLQRAEVDSVRGGGRTAGRGGGGSGGVDKENRRNSAGMVYIYGVRYFIGVTQLLCCHLHYHGRYFVLRTGFFTAVGSFCFVRNLRCPRKVLGSFFAPKWVCSHERFGSRENRSDWHDMCFILRMKYEYVVGDGNDSALW